MAILAEVMAVVKPVTPLAIRMRDQAPIAPPRVAMIAPAPPTETIHPTRKTLSAPAAGMESKVTALSAEAMDRMYKGLTAPVLDMAGFSMVGRGLARTS